MFIVAPIVLWRAVFGPCFVVQHLVSVWCCNHLSGGRECFTSKIPFGGKRVLVALLQKCLSGGKRVLVALLQKCLFIPTDKVNKLIRSDLFSIATKWSSINSTYRIPMSVLMLCYCPCSVSVPHGAVGLVCGVIVAFHDHTHLLFFCLGSTKVSPLFSTF